MVLGTVAGTVVTSQRADRIDAPSYLLIELCDQTGQRKKDFLVALDMIGAGPGEMVLICQGSAARQTQLTDNCPMDAIIVGIIDVIDERGKVVYQKS